MQNEKPPALITADDVPKGKPDLRVVPDVPEIINADDVPTVDRQEPIVETAPEIITAEDVPKSVQQEMGATALDVKPIVYGKTSSQAGLQAIINRVDR